MSNPYVEAWNRQQITLPPIGVVDEPAATNPYVQAHNRIAQGRGHSLLRNLPLPGVVTSFQFTPDQLAASAAFTGSFISGLLKPIAGLLGFPGAVGRGFGFLDEADQLITDRAALTIRSAYEGTQEWFEAPARALGYSDSEIRSTRMLGEVVGFGLPGAGLYKVTGRALGFTAEGLASAPFMSGLKVDVVSGMIWGGVLTEGEIGDRFKNALYDGGLSGGIGLALTGVWPAVAAYRALRLYNMGVDEAHRAELRQLLSKVYGRGSKDQPILLPNAQQARGLFDLMSEESLFINSPEVQRILRQNANEVALASAIADLAGSRSSYGIIRSVSDNVQEAAAVVDKFRSAFPKMKIMEIKNPEGGFDIFFGTKGLNAAQRRQYAKEGRFVGQRLQLPDGQEVTYLGMTPKGKLMVRRISDDQVLRVNPENATAYLYGVDPDLRFPEYDALFQDFDHFFRSKAVAVLNERYGLSEQDLVRLAREGQLTEEILGRRRIREPNAVVNPEEITPPHIVGPALMMPDGQVIYTPRGTTHADTMEEAIKQGYDINPDDIEEFAGFVTDNGKFVDRIEAAHIARRAPIDNDDVLYSEQLNTLVTQSGTEETWLLHPWETIDFEDTVRLWAEEQGLPTSGPEFISLQTYFAARQRSKLLERWKADFPAEAEVLTNMKNEWAAILENEELPLSARAAVKGFHYTEKGGVHQLRDINTGAAFEFLSIADVEEALKRAARGDRDIGPSLIPPNTVEHVMSPNAVEVTPVRELIADALPDNVLSDQILSDIPTRFDKPTRNFLLSVERRTGIPLWTLGFNKIDEAVVQATRDMEPWLRHLDEIWINNGIKSRKDALRIGNYLAKTEGKPLTPTQRYAIAKEMGLSQDDLRAVKEFRRVLLAGFEKYNMNGEHFLRDYYGKILPRSVERGGLTDADLDELFPEGLPSYLKDFPEHLRTRAALGLEADPRIVAARFFRELAFRDHFDKPAEMLKKMINMRVKELPKEQRVRLEKGAGRRLNPDETVIPAPVGDAVKEYINSVSGLPVSSVKAAQGVIKRFWNKLGVKVDERVGTEFLNALLSTMYGAAMGARPMLLARNHLQTMWNLYPRLGPRHFARSMEDAIDPEKFAEVMDALAIRSSQGGLPFYDALYEEMMEVGASGSGTFSNAVAWAINKGVALGNASRRISSATLIPYGNADTFSRAWAYHYQKRHTAEWVNKWEQGLISEATMYERGLPGYDRAIRDEFAARYRHQGKEAALRFIAKQAADETHFVYQLGNHPAWMQSPFGKFMGMFGTWSMNQKELSFQLWRNSTPAQKVMIGQRLAMITGALTLVSYELGVNLWNWMAIMPFSVAWTGGPGVDWAVDLRNVVQAPMDQKAAALKRFATRLPRLALPGQVLFNDIISAIEATDDPALAAFYITLGRPIDRGFMDIEFEIRPPRVETATTGITPATSLAPTPIPDFTINQESLGLSPQFSGGATSSSVTVPNLEILNLLGADVRR